MSRPALKLALKLALLAVFAVLAFGAHAGARSDTVRVAVYRGPASCENCSETLKQAIEALGPNYRVDFVGAHEPIDITPANLARYDVYAQPGGGQNIPAAFASLGDARVDAIHDYVAGGGRYLGICMGAYLASASGLGLIPHELNSEVGRRGFPVATSDDAVVAVRWEGRKETVFYQDGPYLLRPANDPGFRTIATYANNDIAAARYTLGKGLVVLSGPHPEADESWFEEAGLPVDEMPSDRLLRSLLSELGR